MKWFEHAARLAAPLHGLAGGILLGFGLSHFGFLTLRDAGRDSLNPGFPFLNNGTLYGLAGGLETAAGLVCWLRPGQAATGGLVIGMVICLLWYKLTFYFSGGKDCGCLGLLGRLLQVSKSEEKLLPNLALGLLLLASLPALVVKRRRLASPGSAGGTTLALVLAGLVQTAGGQVVVLQGRVDSANYNPSTGLVYSNNQVAAVFTVRLAAVNWQIYVTNQADPTWWSQLLWDGTNTYTLEPNGGSIYARKPPLDDTIVATVSPTPVYCSRGLDAIGMAPLWLAYGFRPAAAITNENGLVALPLNWLGTRNSMLSYGYKWSIGHWVDGRFMDQLAVIRDQSLDLDNRRELLRLAMDYPENLIAFNLRNETVITRREIENGFVAARYECKEWLHTNGFTVPMLAEFKGYLFNFYDRRERQPAYRATLKVDHVEWQTAPLEDATGRQVPGKTYVHDYRYKRSSDTRIYKYAQYQLAAGQSWKTADDPALLRQAEDWLRHGRKYDDFGTRHTVLAWLLLGVILSPVIIWICITYIKTKNACKNRT